MGTTCSAITEDECVDSQLRRPCRNEDCDNTLSIIDEESEADEFPECQSTNLLNQKENIDSAECGGFKHLSAFNSLINPEFPPGFPFSDSDSSQILKPSAHWLSQKSARSPLTITNGNGNVMLRTRTENGRSQHADARELKKPAAKLQLYIETWNMNGQLQEPQKNLSILLDLDGEKHDIYVLGLQEAPNFSGEETIGKLLGDMYSCVGLSLMMSLQLYVFARKSLRPYITGTMVDKVGVGGLGHVIGRQKGAAAVLLGYNKVPLLFITSHLAPHEGKLMERNQQYERIRQSVFMKNTVLCSNCKDSQSFVNLVEPQYKVRHIHNFVEESDVVIWLGDLNYRVEMPRSSGGFLISHNLEEILWTKDQLHRAVQRGEAFKGFSEGPLLFPPTYKFDVGTDTYDTSAKERSPSWTDRILYKVKPSCIIKADLMVYNSIPAVKTSDHKPVKTHLTVNCVQIKPE